MSERSRPNLRPSSTSLTVKVPGIYARTRAEVERRAAVGDPRLLLDETPVALRSAANALSPEVTRMRLLAERMKQRENVMVSGQFARGYPQLVAMYKRSDSGLGYPDLEVSSDDKATLVFGYVAKPGELG